MGKFLWTVVKHIEKEEQEKNIDRNKRISVLNQELEGYNTPQESFDIIMQHYYAKEKTPFVLSFSGAEDSLPMWSMYGNNGHGVCLCIDEKMLIKIETELITNVVLSVLYVNETNNDIITHQIINNTINNECERYYREVGGLTDTDTIIMKKIVTLGILIPFVSSYIKNNSFKYEQEKRIVCFARDFKKQVMFRTTETGKIIPYVKVPLPKNCVKSIILGPCFDVDRTYNSLSLELFVNNLDIKISKSNVPYQIM